MSTTNRRKFLGSGVAAAAAATVAAAPGRAQEKVAKRVIYRNGKKPDKTPLFNSTVAYGNLIFIYGVGYHKEGDIKVHTKAFWIRSRRNSRAWGRRWTRSSSATS